MYVYIIGTSLTGPVKIGKAIDPERRLCELQTAHHKKLHLLFYVNCGAVPAIQVENRTHKENEHLRMRGEWFEMSGQDALQSVLGVLRDLGGKVSEREIYEAPRTELSFFEWLRRQKGREDPVGDLAKDTNQTGAIWPIENEDIEAICEAIWDKEYVMWKSRYCPICHEVVIPAVIKAWEEWSLSKAPAHLLEAIREEAREIEKMIEGWA